MGLILDTSNLVATERQGRSVSDILEQLRRVYGDDQIGISVVTVAELTHGTERAKHPAQRERRQAFVAEVMTKMKVYPVTIEIAQRAGAISGRQAI